MDDLAAHHGEARRLSDEILERRGRIPLSRTMHQIGG